MRLASGTIASLVLTIGALLVLVAVDYSSNNVINSGRRPPKTTFLRSSTRRTLYNYSRNSYNGDNASSYGSAYGTTDDASQQEDSNNYGNNYANYQDNSGNNDSENYSNQNYDNSYYIWQRDDDDNYKNDDASYYNSNSAYQANGYNYNGRDQTYGGQSVQTYTDDEEPEVTEEGYEDEDERWEVLGKFGGLSAKETVAVASLAALVSVSMLFLFLLASGCNLVDICQLCCCCRLCANTTDETPDAAETIEDGFVKLGDY